MRSARTGHATLCGLTYACFRAGGTAAKVNAIWIKRCWQSYTSHICALLQYSTKRMFNKSIFSTQALRT